MFQVQRLATVVGLGLVLSSCGGGSDSQAPAPAAAQDGRARALAIATPAQAVWSAPVPLPLVPAAAANLPDGKVLFWSAEERFSFGATVGRTYSVTFDPVAGTSTERTITETGHNMFCPGTTNLPDGRLLVNGGISTTRTSLFDPATGAWSTGAQMNIPRGYNANTLLADGSVLTLGGSWSGGVGSKHGEVWSEATGWRRMSGIPIDSMLSNDPTTNYGLDSHLWLIPTGHGRVLHAGPGINMHLLDTRGNGAVQAVGPRGDDAFSLSGIAVMYDIGKVLKAGGSPGNAGTDANRNAYVIDMGSGGAVVRKVASMNYARVFHNSVVLPNGQVVIIGGQTRAATFSDDRSVLAAELFDPATETFTVMPPMSVPRNYHGVALLLPDARVIVSGSGLCGVGCAANHPDLQILTPHYLLNADGTPATRPVITASPAQAGHGTEMVVTTDSPVTSFSLVRVSSTTHNVNNDQRRIPLAFAATGANAYNVQVPSNTGIALPGLYMLFAMNADGVPSVSRLVRIGGTGTPQLAWPGEQSHALGAAVNLALSAPGASSFSASGLPPGLSINSATGVITGTVAAEGSYNVTVSASNANGTVSTALLWRVVVVGSTRFVKLEALSEINGNPWSSMAELNLLDESGATVSRSGWVVTADSFEVGEGPARIIDGNPETQWHTQWQAAAPTHPHWVVVDMGTQRRLSGFRYLPYGSDGTGRIALFNFYVSADGINWGSPVASGDFRTMGAAEAEKTVLFAVAQPNRPPVVSTPSAQSSTRGEAAALTVAASDPDGDTLAYGATGLPPGLVIGGSSGVISGTPTTTGNYSVTVSVQDGRGGSASASFAWAVLAPPPTVISPVTAPPAATGSNVTYNASATGSGLQYAWDFGDGTSAPFSTSASVTHVYANAGLYTVTLSVRTTDGSVTTSSFVQAVVRPATTLRPAASSNIVFEARAGANARVWLVNPDNDSVSVFDAVTNAKLAEVTVGTGPRTLAVAGASAWVANRDSATLTLISTSTLAVTQTITLPRASMPYGIAWSATDNAAWLTLEGTGQLLRLDAGGAITGSVAVGPNPRQVSISADGTRVFVSRFITPPLPGEGTASVQTSVGGVPRGAEVVVVDGGTRAVLGSAVLAHSEKPDNTIQGRGVPNYLGAAVIAPDGGSAWVPSKQDNIKRGPLRDGLPLDFQNTVRAISSRIDLATLAEDHAARVDHDNSSVASAAAFHPSGAYLFVALETSRQVAVLDPAGYREVMRFDAGRAPQGLAVSADGLRLFVSNFMDRSVTVHDLTRLVQFGEYTVPAPTTLAAVGSERLTAQVLAGKRLFYDARDPRLARDSYLSCASCHRDGGSDGRVWDLRGQGEGLRNTISLRGRAGSMGRLHWSNNFDEVQDFENQIRSLAQGNGLMTDAQFNAGTRSQPLGDAKAGVSADLDALAAYVGSLNRFEPSPHRPSAGALSALATEGRQAFISNNCAACHSGSAFTRSGIDNPADVGTLKPTSGQRLFGTLGGIDVPTLRDVWATAPYLHDGSAATLEDAVRAHTTLSVPLADLPKLAAYLREIGSDEGPAPSAAVTTSIWPASAAPSVASYPDSASVNLGLKFTADQSGFVTAIRFYKGASNTGTHIGSLWTASGQLLASVAFAGETASGWQQADLANPVAIDANTTYVVSYLAPNGGYAADSGYFAVAGVDSPPLRALRNGVNGGNGLYAYAATTQFPTGSFQSTNYWVDVVFASGAVSDSTPPTVTSTSPTGGATNVSRTSIVSATFSEALNAASVTGSTVQLRDAANAVVPATVSYDSATRVASLTPSTALAPASVYTATVFGGTSGVTDVAGNALAVNRTWSFTTAAGDTTPPTVTATSPTGGAVGISRTANITATFSEAMDAATINTASIELRGPGDVLVPAVVTWSATNRRATLNPNPTLAALTTYTVTVRGGSTDPRVKDLAGNALAANRVWSFTTR